MEKVDKEGLEGLAQWLRGQTDNTTCGQLMEWAAAVESLQAAPEPFIYVHELIRNGGGVWLGCADKKVMEQSHVEGETGEAIIPLYLAPSVAAAVPAGEDSSVNAATRSVEADTLGSSWRTIESAPKDGTMVLVLGPAWGDGKRPECPHYYCLAVFNGEWLDAENAETKLYPPTYWTPIPSPPAAGAQQHGPEADSAEPAGKSVQEAFDEVMGLADRFARAWAHDLDGAYLIKGQTPKARADLLQRLQELLGRKA